MAANLEVTDARLSKILLIIAAVPLACSPAGRGGRAGTGEAPGDVNRTNHYSGTVSVFVDAKTTTDLATPQDRQ